MRIWHIDVTLTVLKFQVKVNLRVMTMIKYFPHTRSLKMKPEYQMQVSDKLTTPHFVCSGS